MADLISNDDIILTDDEENLSSDESSNFASDFSDDVIPDPDTSNHTIGKWLVDNTSTAGTPGTAIPSTTVPSTSEIPVLVPVEKTVYEYINPISDFSAAYLEDLYDEGYKFYAVYSDGTEAEVSWNQIQDPYAIPIGTVLDEVNEAAAATNQHFWYDSNGGHVTDVEKDDWVAAVLDSFSDLSANKQYHNILINSLGMLLRSALNNLLALSRSGMTVYDGLGNDISNVLALFSSSGAAFRESGKTRATVTTQGLTVYDDSGSLSNGTETYGNQVAFIGIDNSGKPFTRIGKSAKGYIEIGVNTNDNGYIDFYNGSTILAHIGYDAGTNDSGGVSNAPYYTFGDRKASSTIGNYSMAEGRNTTASHWCSHAEGWDSIASGWCSHAEGSTCEATGECSHAEGSRSKAIGHRSHAGGTKSKAIGYSSFVHGYDLIANYDYQTVIGIGNSNLSEDLFEIGNGEERDVQPGSGVDIRYNAFRVTNSSRAYAGSTSLYSDKRIKTDLGILDISEATEFIKSLIPHKYEKFGRKELGFFAQDVEQDPNYGEILVEQYEDHGYKDFRSLSYDGLIAPIVATLQKTMSRVDELEEENRLLKNRLAKIEELLGIE